MYARKPGKILAFDAPRAFGDEENRAAQPLPGRALVELDEARLGLAFGERVVQRAQQFRRLARAAAQRTQQPDIFTFIIVFTVR